MQKLAFILFLFSFAANAQDKLFFKNGTSQKGYILTMGKDFIYFKTSDTSATQKINKSSLVLIEDYKGTRYLFSGEPGHTDSVNIQAAPSTLRRNIFSLQPLGIFFGRGTLVYERLSSDNKIGVVFPVSLTFDPFGSLYNTNLDTTQNGIRKINGVNFITGLDINFYLGKSAHTKFFVGPRVRYGTDLFLRNIEGYTLQTQFGWKVSSEKSRFVQHLSFGFGFVRVLSSPAGKLINPKQSYGWYSLNYRVGLSW
jgi:hypothetical protein